MYERILVPLDGSELAEAAIPFVELIPSRHVRLIRVEPAPTDRQAEPDTARLTAAPEERTAAARSYLERQAEGLRRQGRAIEIDVDVGDPRERIIAATTDTDLIVIGTRGQSVGGRAAGDSVADHVLRAARQPTLLVRGALSQVAPLVTRIVVPLDGSAIAEKALPVAARLSRILGVRPHLVRVVPEPAPAMEGDSPRQEAEVYLGARALALATVDVLATQAVLKGSIGSTLLAAIVPTDLAVMTAHGAGGSHAPLGSVAEQLVAEAAGPTLLLHEED